MNNYDFYIKDRDRYLNKIINSDAPRKLIIAGPGTGKTYTFRKLLEKSLKSSNKKGLVITFIKNLVKDLDRDLKDLADVRTFHSFCRSQITKIKRPHFEYYPNLLRIIEKDLSILDPSFKKEKTKLDSYFFELKEKKIEKAIKIGDYYNAVGHTDSVYRVFKYYELHPEAIPEYPIVLVDEYQDFNLLETKLIEKLALKNPILIVGDDDQALYNFKNSSPNFLRNLVKDDRYEKFSLPYCQRCTKVIVDAVNKIIEVAKRSGRLNGRIDKPFKYFAPDKSLDSIENPRIIYVHCSVENKNCHYAGKYICNEILNMPRSYVNEAEHRNEPAVLIIGPRHFLDGVKKELSARNLPIEERKKERENGYNILDAYKILLRNPESKLGWRIIMEFEANLNIENIIRNSISKNESLFKYLKAYNDFYKSNLILLDILKKVKSNKDLNQNEERLLMSRIRTPLDKIKSFIMDQNIEDADDRIESDKESKGPRILFTSFEGSKGLAAQYVFIVGLNKGHCPKNDPPDDRDIFKFIVALTRGRKRAYIISYGNYAGNFLQRSIFINYIKAFLSDEVLVDKLYMRTICRETRK
ncbi:MAG: ATP-dependent helicase [Candidatus Aminicenantes bacterium]|nr:ATP-dependent helicase [Candidatus Aminicenantes bacterium]